jgi:hypothetical protein
VILPHTPDYCNLSTEKKPVILAECDECGGCLGPGDDWEDEDHPVHYVNCSSWADYYVPDAMQEAI